jgi:hypothetical protein
MGADQRTKYNCLETGTGRHLSLTMIFFAESAGSAASKRVDGVVF